jgi:Na+-driven multidrug efflux pump
MPSNAQPMRLGGIFRFWAPMAGTWLMMSVEAPFLAAVIARLDDPKQNLAAFGVAFAVAILVESPVIMILSASTALVRGPLSFRRLRLFTQALNVAITALMLLLLLTPAWRSIAAHGIGLPPRVVELTQIALLVLLPWPWAIGYRRFFQGLMIRSGQTRRVAYGTVVRVATMAGTGLVLFSRSDLPGAVVGAAALSLGVSAEALASRLMVREALRETLAVDPADDTEMTYRSIAGFYTPLALTSMIGLAVHPVVSFFMGHARAPLESLAVLPVVNSMSFIFRSVGLSYQEVAIAALGRNDRNYPLVARFGFLLAVGASLAMAAIAFTPLADVWFRGLSGLSAELTGFALAPARILTLLPALSVLLSLQRAVLVHGRTTAPITWSTAIEVVGIVLALVLLIVGLDVVGATAAALAFIAGRVAGNLYLVPPYARVRP